MSYFTIILDTTAPASPMISFGSQYTTTQLVNANISTSDAITTGYEVLLWGNIDVAWAKSNGLLPSGSAASTVTEANALWTSYSTVKQIKLTDGDGLKTVYLRIRDDVHNVSSQVSAQINLDMSLPAVTIVGGKADVDKVSADTERNTANFSFRVDKEFTEYRVCFVTSPDATHSQGVIIGTVGGSQNTNGDAGNYEADTNYSVTLKGSDIKSISSQDGVKGIKVFVKDLSGKWSA